jgi:hypothetical protein
MSSQLSLWPVHPQGKQARVWQSLTVEQQARVVEVLARIFAQVISAHPAPVLKEDKHE